ncbi:HAD family hydrolase [Zeaxanthinibacter enoshimensis]|uniref:Putative hydrolase of the HAD superfamily n=1 Tax=Zeaxanthinibacter enoshimensis TaxID=392009 RepID=A0A4R6TR38_9FLAO|nr:HAD family hydrolase [Zeaxanthinibacter enoshimensis]TDQ32777.1 putative hydrolase of the HAD superfamily [Zeaxanthinibacter enoshimensis]
MPKHIILDLDNSIYSYDAPHQASMEAVFSEFQSLFGINREILKKSFAHARMQTQLELPARAASHNRLLYFQKMIEALGLNSLKYGLHFYNTYWETFLDRMELDKDVKPMLESFHEKGMRICLLTDLTAHIQFRKVEKFHLTELIYRMVSSEEVGVEKPHPYMFTKALQKLECTAGEAIMIGDSWEKDIVGAQAMGIRSIWINRKNEIKDLPDSVQEVAHFNEIIL